MTNSFKSKTDSFDELMKLSNELESRFSFYIFSHPERAIHLSSFVLPKHFLNNESRRWYDLAIRSQVEGIDLVSLARKEGVTLGRMLEAGSQYDPLHLNSHDESLAKQIRQIRQTYDMVALFEEFTTGDLDYLSIDRTASEIHSKFVEICSRKEAEKSGIVDVMKDYEGVQKVHSDNIQNGHTLIGLSCGFERIDKAIDGFRPGHLWTIGGYTSSGKTFMSLNMAASLIRAKRRVVYYSLEMSKTDIVSRVLGIICDLNGTKILKGSLEIGDAKRVENAKKLMVDSGMSIHSEARDIEMIRLSMLEEHMKKPVDVFMLDYIQLVSVTDADNNYDTMRIAATAFQSIAKEINVPILLLSQVSNEAARGKSSDVIGFKGAGDIAAVSDLGAELVIDEPDKEVYMNKLRDGEPIHTRLHIKKNRHGEIGSIPFDFDKVPGKFYEGFKDK